MEMTEQAKWFDFAIDGTDTMVRLKIRPLYVKKVFSLNEKHAVTQKKKSYKIKGLDWDNLLDEIIDYVLEDFTGMDGKPASANLENKKKFLNFPFECNGKSLVDFVMEKGRELGGIPESKQGFNEREVIARINKNRRKKK